MKTQKKLLGTEPIDQRVGCPITKLSDGRSVLPHQRASAVEEAARLGGGDDDEDDEDEDEGLAAM